MRRDLVVIGASAGGLEAIRTIVAAIPADFPAAICFVMHMATGAPRVLDTLIGGVAKLPAVTVKDSERLTPSRIYLPCPDHHLVIEPGVIRATRGPRENRFRPAIDPLFRSAAQVYGPRTIGIILTGWLGDGTAGLWAIKQLGGLAIVQDPDEALAASMPASALHHVNVDHRVRVAEIAPLLERLVRADLVEQGGYTVPEPLDIEVKIAAEQPALEAGVLKLGEPSPYACPECHGVLLQMREGDRTRYRCHTGHAYSADALLASFDDAIEDSLWTSVRSLQEKALFLEHMAEHVRDSQPADAQALLDQARDAYLRAESVRRTAIEQGERDGHKSAA